MRFLVTGANGFVGSALCRRLLQESGASVRGAIRGAGRLLPPGVEPVVVGPIGASTNWTAAVTGVNCVVHLAARVHRLRDRCSEPLAAYREVNVRGTTHLAATAAEAGVKRLVFLSSVKALGEERNAPYTSTDEPRPSHPYGISKWEAEQALQVVARDTGLEVVVLRPPLVYGPGVRANFLDLLKAIDRGIPLPFGAIQNRRSLLFAGNLADAILAVARCPAAAGRTYLVSDGEDLSTPELVRRIAAALGRREKLLAVPPRWLKWGARLTGQTAVADRLLGSLTVDATPIRHELGWQFPYTLSQGLEKTAAWFRESVRGF